MRKLTVVVSSLVALALFCTTPLFAQGRSTDNAVKVVVTGTNYCVACALKEQGAQATCDAGHQHALKVADIKDANGELVRGFPPGRTIYYLDNAKGKEIAGADNLHGKAVKVEGTLYKDESAIDVASYEEIAGGLPAPETISGQTPPPAQK